jgi:tRNA(Ile)-lysidine synthase
MPLLTQMNGQAVEALFRTSQIVRESIEIYNRGIEETFAEHLVTPQRMPLSLFRQSPVAQTLLHEWLSGRGFSSTQEQEVLRSLDTIPGHLWNSKSYSLLLDRNELLLKEKNTTQEIPFQISQTIVPSISETGPYIAYFDADLIHEPLTMRLCKTGDYFYPLGLGRRKLLSDFMTDRKLSLFAKQSQVVLCHGEDIIWLVGLRSDHRYRVTQQTKRILKITGTPAITD